MNFESQPRSREQRDAFVAELSEAKITAPPDMSPREVVVMMLTIGAHIEHALMVQYLYAGYSLRPKTSASADVERVEVWRSALLSVAREEMGHLLTVQNILTLLGAPTDFGRDTSPWALKFYPFPFELEPFRRDVLVRFIFAEMPPPEALMTSSEKQTRSEKHTKPGKSLHAKREPSADVLQHLKDDIDAQKLPDLGRRVGPTYAAIIKLLSNAMFVPESCFDEASYDRQASSDEWSRNYRPHPRQLTPDGDREPPPPRVKEVRAALRDAFVQVKRVATRSDAIQALRELSEQGEAPHLGLDKLDALEEPSHFERLLDVYKDLLQQGPPETAVISNPTTREDWAQTGGSAFTLIKDGRARYLAQVFNQRYHLLLDYLAHTFRIPRPAHLDRPHLRSMLMHRAFAEMYNLKTLAGLLVDLPISEQPGETRKAGPPFELPPSLSLPMRETDIWRGHRELLLASGRTLRLFLDPSTYGGRAYASEPPFDGSAAQAFATTMLQIDAATSQWIDAILAGASGREANF